MIKFLINLFFHRHAWIVKETVKVKEYWGSAYAGTITEKHCVCKDCGKWKTFFLGKND